MSKKKLEFTEEVVKNDLIKFLSGMNMRADEVEEKISKIGMVEELTPLFNSGELRLEEGDVLCLVHTLSDGVEIKMRSKRAKLIDLNRIKPPNYDKMDRETRELVRVSYLTNIPFDSLLKDYYISDLQLATVLCNFL